MPRSQFCPHRLSIFLGGASRSRRQGPALLLATWFAFVLATPGAEARPPGARIVNGVLTSGYPSTGALLRNPLGATPANATSWCSGTLIGCETFLTAAHCVEDATPGNYVVFLQHAGFFDVASIASHPSYPEPDATGDIAILKLATPVTGIAPSPVRFGADVPFGTAGTIVGFGQSGGQIGDFGLKREGDVLTGSCGSVSADSSSICWEFEDPIGPAGDDSNTCSGDSGGPIFIDNGCGLAVAGATSFGVNGSCMAPDTSADSSTTGHEQFILDEGGADLDNLTCGAGISQAGDSSTIIEAFTGLVSGGSPQASHSFAIGVGVTELRVALNARDDISSDFNLYLRHGAPATTSTFDCAADSSTQYGACIVSAPTGGTWHLLVDRVSGSGEYQITATVFAGAPGAFPNDGSVCDDANTCTTGDTCGTQVCTGPALADGSTCDDGSLCTEVDQCAAGTCIGDPTPRATCKAPPGRATLILSDKSPDSRDKLVLKMSKGPATDVSEYQDPPAGGTDHHVCVYDETATGHQLVVDSTAAGGATCAQGKPCWKALGAPPKGFRYVDRDRTPDGLLRTILLAGDTGKSKAIVVGKGPKLDLPGPALGGQYLEADGTVTAQIVQSDGDCWSATFDGAAVKKNEADQFKAACGSAAAPCQ